MTHRVRVLKWCRFLQYVLGSVFVARACLYVERAEAQGPDRSGPGYITPDQVYAHRMSPLSVIRVDGVLDETIWRTAEPIGDLHQQEPDEGAPATERTEIRIVFDSTTAYVGIVAYDRDVTGVIGRILQRDRVMELDGFGGLRFAGDDGVAILIDSFHDHRNAIILATNPNGAEFDAQISDEGREINVNWRGVWSVASARRGDGWSTEFAVPLSTLRTGGGGEGTWGFNVYRVIRRNNEHALWRSWRRGSEGFLRVSSAGDIHGVNEMGSQGLGLDVKPYLLMSGTDQRPEPDRRNTLARSDLGVDFKYELRNGLVVDATVNSDFAQADVDEEQVNLTRFDLFLPEKREFFLENSGIFQFGVNGNGEQPPFLLFFSRRVGVSDSGVVPLLGGIRVSGRAGQQTVGLLHAVTDRAFGRSRQSHTVARLKRDVGGAGYVGAMVTRVGRSDAPSVAGGIDWSLWPVRSLNVQGFAVRTSEQVSGGDVLAYRVGVDYQTDRIGFSGQHLAIGPDVRADLGFVTRTDVRRTGGLLRITARPTALGLRRMDLMVVARYVVRTTGEFQDWVTGPAVGLTWGSGDNLTPYFKVGRTRLDNGFELGGRVSIPAADYLTAGFGLMASTSAARSVSGSVHLVRQEIYNGRLLTANFTTRVLLGARLAHDVGFTHSDVMLPGGTFVANVASLQTAYSFSTRLFASTRIQFNQLDRRLSIRARLSFQHRPGSDLFVVLQDGRSWDGLASAGEPRAAVVKLTWLMRW